MLRNQLRTKQIISFCCYKNPYFACSFCIGKESEKYWLRGTSAGHPAPTFPLKQDYCQHQIRSAVTLFMWVLETTKDGDSTTCLGNLFQCCMFLSVKKFFPMSSLNLPSCSCCCSTQLPNASSCCSLFSTCHCQEVFGCTFLQMLFWSRNFSNRMENRNVFDVKHS